MALPSPWWLLSLLACSSGETRPDSGATAPTAPPPEVVDLDIACRSGLVADTECFTLEVTCEDLPPLIAEVRVSRPPPEVTPRKLLMVSSGGGGDSYWNNSLDVGEDLVTAGYVLVDRRWQEPWTSGEAGLVRASCRYAALLRWVHVNQTEDLPVCTVGNSLGASEVATVLVTRPEADLVTAATLSSGPTLTRLDLGCVPDSDPSWPEQCEALAEDIGVCTDALSGCSVHENADSEIPGLIDLAFPGTPCSDQDITQVEALRAESTWPTQGDPVLTVPTEVLVGSQDCSGAIPYAALFAELSGATPVTLEGASHKLQSTSEGLAAIVDSVERICVD